MPSSKNDGRGEVKNPETDGRLKENQRGSGRSRGGPGGSRGGSSGSSGGSRGGASGGSR